ncbi:unnamed protein product [Linum trigynum]|uniref:C2H2-type domain-containing protein n=1 Tax=Linum trigynum TaxID=586398 RepID=A0AAV2GLJ7_9ROSI
MTMKRFPAARAAGDNRQLRGLAGCLILLSKYAKENDGAVSRSTTAAVAGRFFECKTCEKKLTLFQVLGSPRASHNKPNKMGPAVSGEKPNNKAHECATCGSEFTMGQALGGHMRRHRAALSLLPALATMKISSSSAAENRATCLDLDLNLTPVENDDLSLRLGKSLHIA